MKVFKYPYLFVKAFNATKREMLVSMIILVLLTFILAAGMYLAESRVNLDFSYWDALVWHFVKYVDDPSEIASAPVTTLGKVLGTIEGLINVAIFAVPAGLVGSGLINAMDETRHEKKIAEASVKLHKRFRRVGQSKSWYLNEERLKRTYICVPRFLSLNNIMVKTGMNINDIIDTVNHCPDMRLTNLATTERRGDKPQDRLVVEHFPLNREYGCCLDRQSDVTIVAPAAASHIGSGSAAFSLAAMGGFNYVSKEIEPSIDDPFGFFSMNKSTLDKIGDYDVKEDIESQALHFMDDLRNLKKRSEDRNHRHWFIFIMGSLSLDCHIEFWRSAVDKKKKMENRIVCKINDINREDGSLVMKIDEEKIQNIFLAIKNKLNDVKITFRGKETNIISKLDINDGSVGDSNLMVRMGGGVDSNALCLRIVDDILVYSNNHLAIVKVIADALKSQIEPDREIDAKAKRCYLEKGDGYADEYGKEEVFKKSPETLKEMIKKQSKYAREKFEKYDLDWNEIGLPPRNAFTRLWQKIREAAAKE